MPTYTPFIPVLDPEPTADQAAFTSTFGNEVLAEPTLWELVPSSPEHHPAFGVCYMGPGQLLKAVATDLLTIHRYDSSLSLAAMGFPPSEQTCRLRVKLSTLLRFLSGNKPLHTAAKQAVVTLVAARMVAVTKRGNFYIPYPMVGEVTEFTGVVKHHR